MILPKIRYQNLPWRTSLGFNEHLRAFQPAAWSMPGYIEELCLTEPALIAELLQLFLRDAAASMEGLAEQTKVFDIAATARTLHTLKGSCMQMGGHMMGQLLEEMEERLRDHGIEATCELLPILRAAFQAMRAGIENWMLTVAINSTTSEMS